MKRLTVLVLAIFILSAGCRMCGSDYDYCMPAIVEGGVQNAGPLYRAGSILNGMSGNYDRYFVDQDCATCEPNNSLNFIEYNDTETENLPNSNNTQTIQPDDNKGWQGTGTGVEIGIPRTAPQNNGNNGNNGNINTPKTNRDYTTPSLEELMEMNPPKPIKTPQKNNNTPNADVIPDNFTLDNLRKLDPSVNDADVQEVKIIKVEDKILK
jgi:hypothetical protein